MKTICPRHDDRSPSLRIAPDGSHWKCMACQRGGAAVSLVRWITGASFEDAVKEVMNGEQGDPVMLFALQQVRTDDDSLPARIGAWAIRKKVLTQEQVDGIMMGDRPELTLMELTT